MSVEELRRSVLEKARKEAEAIIAKAETEAKSIIEKAKNRKKSIIEEEKAKIVSELNPEVRLAEARYKARIIVAEAKSSVVNEINNSVIALLRGLSREKRLESLIKLAEEAVETVLDSVGSVSEIDIKLSPQDMEFANIVKRRIEERYRVKVTKIEKANILGGIIVEYFDGSVAINNSYDERLKKALRSMLPSLMKAL
jgi:V/A-type H+-transporting ATPase subunit E